MLNSRMRFATRLGRRLITAAGVLFWLQTTPAAFGAATHYVFAHYMVCFATYGDFGGDTNSTIAGYKREIQEAQAAGIDGFALNVGDYDDLSQYYYNTRVAEIYEAAEELGTGFKLFFSVDFAGPTNIVDMVQTYANRTNTFRYQGKVVLSAYTLNGMDWQHAILGKLRTNGVPVYFVPYCLSNPVNELPTYANAMGILNTYTNLLDGLFLFGAAGLAPQLAQCNSNYTQAVHSVGKIFMASVAPTYWGCFQPSTGRRYYELDGGEGLLTQWQSIIASQPDWVEITTWNDFNESTYVSPVADPGTYFSQLHTPRRYSHQGYLELSKRYIAWFKSGQPPVIGEDGLFYFYRSHPENCVATNLSDTPVVGLHGDVADQIYVTTMLTAPAQVEIRSGSLFTTNQVPAGTSSFRTDFTPGAQSFVLRRAGSAVLSIQGPDIMAQIADYDYFPAAGYSYGISPPVQLQISN